MLFCPYCIFIQLITKVFCLSRQAPSCIGIDGHFCCVYNCTKYNPIFLYVCRICPACTVHTTCVWGVPVSRAHWSATRFWSATLISSCGLAPCHSPPETGLSVPDTTGLLLTCISRYVTMKMATPTAMTRRSNPSITARVPMADALSSIPYFL